MKFVALLSLLLCSACASLGPQFTKAQKASKDQSLIYIYRVKKFAGSAGSPYLCLDKKVVGEVPNGGYFPLEMSPGSYELTMRGALGENLASFPFTVKANHVYYVRTDFSLNSGARENTDVARQAALGPGGGGALGAGIGAVVNDQFFGDEEEGNKILTQLDKRAQQQSKNPGFLFVKPEFAEAEIAQTKLFTVPPYKMNPCK